MATTIDPDNNNYDEQQEPNAKHKEKTAERNRTKHNVEELLGSNKTTETKHAK